MGKRALVVGVLASASCYREAPPPPVVGSQPVVQVPRRASTDPLAYLPIDSELVLHLDARQVRASSLWRRFEPNLRSRAGMLLVTFQDLCGFDPIATIRTVALGVKEVGSQAPSGVFVLRGIDRNAVMTCYHRHEVQSRKAHKSSGTMIDRGVVLLPPDTSGESPIAFAFADDSTLVVLSGPSASTQAMLDTLEAGSPLRASDAFNALLGITDTADALWLVVNGSAKMLDTFALFNVKPRALTGSLDLHDGLIGDFRLRLDAADEAARLAAMLQQQASGVPQLQAMLQRLDITSDGADLVVGLGLTEQQAESIASMVLGAAGP
jgi:hypothetical protein